MNTRCRSDRKARMRALPSERTKIDPCAQAWEFDIVKREKHQNCWPPVYGMAWASSPQAVLFQV
jgi:hypothetical protein